MSPFIHGRIYPETQSSELLGYSLRVLVDPRIVQDNARALMDIDTLRIYLRDIESPCRIVLLIPAQRAQELYLNRAYEFLRRLGVEELPSSRVVAPEAASAFTNAAADSDQLALASTACLADADVVISEEVTASLENVAGFRKLQTQVTGVQGALSACEVFVRGLEVPWSFQTPAWLMPWTTFYAMVDRDIREMQKLMSLASKKGVSQGVQERMRSVGLNRWSAIVYTRDKLLFYLIQRRRARRHKLERQDFTFELTYHLTAYFLLFWGALDQFSWIVNEVCDLGFTSKDWLKVGVTKASFLNRLREKDPVMMATFQDAEFLRWVEVLRLGRHYVAHQGTAMLSPLVEKPTSEPSLADIDRDIERSAEWQKLARQLAPVVMEALRPTFRTKWKLKSYRTISDEAWVLPGATASDDTAILFPLENIEWDYQRFREFALAVLARCSAILTAKPDQDSTCADTQPEPS